MIPSRPLSLAEIIAETFGIVRRMMLRYWLLFALLILPGAILGTIGLQELASQKIDSIRTGLHYSDSTLTQLRDETRSSLRARSEFFALEEQALGVQDSLSLNGGNTHIQEVRRYFEHDPGDLSAFGIIVAGMLLTLIGVLALFAATVDLASQVFEEREQSAADALKAAFRTHFVRMLALHLIYWSVMLFINIVLNALSQVSIGLSSVLASVATLFELYATMRLTCAVPSLVSEELGPIASIKRSWELTRGFAGRTLGLWVAFGLVLFVSTLGVSAIGGLIFPEVMDWLQHALSMRPLTFAWLLESLPTLFWSFTGEMLIFVLLLGAFVPVFATVCYYDLRTRKDGPLVYLD